jgi:hypothetical protein
MNNIKIINSVIKLLLLKENVKIKNAKMKNVSNKIVMIKIVNSVIKKIVKI